ncbi:MAG: hypothetical protein CME90_00915 [Hoeflea sp.]|nr:hypothetical protein [Hoeflea sp.]
MYVQNSFRLMASYFLARFKTRNGGTAMFEALTVITVLFLVLFSGLTFAAMRNSMSERRQTVRITEKARR